MRARLLVPATADPRDVAQVVLGPGWLLKAERNPGEPPEPALRELLSRIMSIYRDETRKLLGGIHAIGEKLEKATKPSRPILTPAERAAIIKLIQDHHATFAARIGAVLPLETPELDALIAGLDVEPLLEEAYRHGLLAAEGGELQTLVALRRRIERSGKLTELEQASAAAARASAGAYIQNVGQKVAHEFTAASLAEEAELRRKYIATIKDETAGAIERREGWQRLASNLAHSTDDWERDMRRVAATELSHAHQEGFANTIIKREGEGALAAKLVSPSACPDCVRLHLTEGQGSPPKVFPMRELLGNGTNVGRKQRNWQATIGPVHPWCQCRLIHVPPGYRFQEEPDEGSGFQRVGKGNSWEKNGKPWQPSLELAPHERNKSELSRDLRKSFLQYSNAPESGCTIRVGDPSVRLEVERVVADTPPALFHRDVGVTLITTDHARPLVGLGPDDLAYWTGNEIRLGQTLPAELVRKVLTHELGHALNVALLRQYGAEGPVYEWQGELDRLAAVEGYVSAYPLRVGRAADPADRDRIRALENAAEVCRWYLYAPARLQESYPQQHAFVDSAFGPILFKTRA